MLAAICFMKNLIRPTTPSAAAGSLGCDGITSTVHPQKTVPRHHRCGTGSAVMSSDMSSVAPQGHIATLQPAPIKPQSNYQLTGHAPRTHNQPKFSQGSPADRNLGRPSTIKLQRRDWRRDVKGHRCCCGLDVVCPKSPYTGSLIASMAIWRGAQWRSKDQLLSTLWPPALPHMLPPKAKPMGLPQLGLSAPKAAGP